MDATGKVFSPARLRALELRNRVIKTATYEGMSPVACPPRRSSGITATWPPAESG